MDVKFTLWDAVEHNNQIELLLTRLEDEFKNLKQKGYKMNFNVSEKLKEFYKQIDILVEEQAKLNNQEDKYMNFPYKGYTLEIESKEEDGTTRLIGRCREIGWMLSTLGGYDYLIDRYKKDIDSLIKGKEKQREIDEQKKKEAREVPDLLKSIDEKLDSMRQEFKKSGLAFNILGSKKEPKKESSRLSLTYRGYRMEIVNTINYEGKLYFTGKCEIMNFDKSSISITSLIEDFEKTVDVVVLMNK